LSPRQESGADERNFLLTAQNAIEGQPVMIRAAMRALAAEQTLVTTAACLDIGHGNEGLGAHACTVAQQNALAEFSEITSIAPTSHRIGRRCAQSRVAAVFTPDWPV
jgi:hypothetical protein